MLSNEKIGRPELLIVIFKIVKKNIKKLIYTPKILQVKSIKTLKFKSESI